jgi:hypothetical protein
LCWNDLDESGRAAVGLAERVADGLVSEEECERFRQLNEDLTRAAVLSMSQWDLHLEDLHHHLMNSDLEPIAFFTFVTRAHAGASGYAIYPSICDLLREIVGNPFRPAIVNANWLRWRDGLVEKMVSAIYDERRFAELPVLADALEDAGCDNTDLLAHLRGPGPHVLGCWALDALLGKT